MFIIDSLASQDLETKRNNIRKKPVIYYGYIIALICFIMMVFGWGMFYIYGVFFTPLIKEFNWTRAVTSGAFSLSVLISGLSGIITGRLCDRWGLKAVSILCSVILATGYILMSVIQNVWQFYLIYGLLVAAGVGGFWAPPVSTVAHWFTKSRGLMTGIVSGGVSFGTLMLPPIATQLITAYNWRVTYVVIGITVLVIVIISAQFLRKSPYLQASDKSDLKVADSATSTRNGFTLWEAISTRQFWMVAIIYFCFGIVQLTIMVHIVPQATGLNISDFSAATILSVIGGTSLVGRITMGLISDRIRVKASMIICLSLMTLSLIWLQFSESLWKFYIFAVVFGFGYGGLSCMQSLIAAELYGLLALGVVTAIFSFSFDIGGAIGPVLAGHIYDISSSYFWAFLLCLVLAAIALIVSLLIKPPKKTKLKK